MKERITITIDEELLTWLDGKVERKVFANRSHGFEFLIFERKGSEKGSNETMDNEASRNKKISHEQKSGSKDDQNKKRKNNED